MKLLFDGVPGIVSYYYKRTRYPVILSVGMYRNIEYLILDVGMHPTAYFGIPLTHSMAYQDYDNVNINVHGGLTYGKIGDGEIFSRNKKWFGWDYGHSGDWSGTYSLLGNMTSYSYGKKWTFKEILTETILAIDEFIQLYPN